MTLAKEAVSLARDHPPGPAQFRIYGQTILRLLLVTELVRPVPWLP